MDLKEGDKQNYIAFAEDAEDVFDFLKEKTDDKLSNQ